MAGSAIIGRELRAAMSKTLRDVMLLAENNLENATPVDTGHASTNWILTTGQPHRGVVGSREAVDPVPQAAAVQKLQDYDIVRDGTIYLRNNVFYLHFLNQGWSQQAVANFVYLAMIAAARRAPGPRRAAVRRMLTKMSHAAYVSG